MQKIVLSTLISLSLLFIQTSCVSDKKLENQLYECYKEEFIVEERSFLKNILPSYHGHLKSDESVEISGQYNSEGFQNSNYPEIKWGKELDEIIYKLEDKDVPSEIVARSRINFIPQHECGEKVKDLNELLNNKSITNFSLNYYLFNDVNEQNKEEVLKGVQEVITYFNSIHGLEIKIKIYFWDSSFWNNYDPEKSTFSFGYYTRKDELDLPNTIREYVKHTLQIKFHTPVEETISVEKLFSLVKEMEDQYQFMDFNELH